MKFRAQLILLVVAVALPMMIFAGVMIVSSYKQHQNDLKEDMRIQAGTISAALDREFLISIQSLKVLGASSRLNRRDLREFYSDMQAAHATNRRGWQNLTLADASGRQLINLRRPLGAALPSTGDAAMIEQARQLKEAVIGDLSRGPLTGALAVVVHVPVLRQERVEYFLNAVIYPTVVNDLIARQKLPQNWFVTIVDRNNVVVSTTLYDEQTFGKPAPPPFAAEARSRRGGFWREMTARGQVIATAYHSDLSGWTIGVAIPVASLEGPLKRSLTHMTVGGVAILLLAVGFATAIGRRISRPVAALADAAAALGRGELVRAPSSSIVEIDQVGRELEAGAARRRAAEEEIRHNLDRIQALHEIDTAISSTLDLQAVLQVLLEKVELFFPIAAASTVRLIDPWSRRLRSVACRNLDEADWKAATLWSQADLHRMLPQSNAVEAVLDGPDDPRSLAPELLRRYGLVSYLRVPLVFHGKIVGLLTVFTKTRHEFTAEEINFLETLGGQAAIAIHNSLLYAEIKNQKEQLEKSARVKDEFLSVMSHELRTPLSIVMGYVAMIKDEMLGEINARQSDALKKILLRAGEQLNMVNEIMQTTQIESRATVVEQLPLRLDTMMTALEKEFELQNNSGIALSWKYPREPVEFRSDPAKLKQIVQNLVNNAIKFTRQGSIAVSAELGAPAAGKLRRTLRVKVTDTGPGIPADKLPHIFKKFYQVDSSETRLFGGVGLGLFIAQRFTEMMGGKIEVESEPGRGSTFTVSIPVRSPRSLARAANQ